jgi:hypothetical protein
LTSDGPAALLRSVLSALAGGGGAEALWAALDDRARAPLGDVAGAARALSGGLWAPLLGPAAAEIADLDERGAVARARLRVTGPGGEALYLVSLRRGASGWRISGLVRDDLPWV